MIRRTPRSTLTVPLFPSTPLFRSVTAAKAYPAILHHPEAPALGAIVRIQLFERNHAMRNALHLQVMVGAGHVIEQQHSTVPAAEELLQGQDLATVAQRLSGEQPQ